MAHLCDLVERTVAFNAIVAVAFVVFSVNFNTNATTGAHVFALEIVLRTKLAYLTFSIGVPKRNAALRTARHTIVT